MSTEDEYRGDVEQKNRLKGMNRESSAFHSYDVQTIRENLNGPKLL
jgi:hypothetical protein